MHLSGWEHGCGIFLPLDQHHDQPSDYLPTNIHRSLAMARLKEDIDEQASTLISSDHRSLAMARLAKDVYEQLQTIIQYTRIRDQAAYTTPRAGLSLWHMLYPLKETN